MKRLIITMAVLTLLPLNAWSRTIRDLFREATQIRGSRHLLHMPLSGSTPVGIDYKAISVFSPQVRLDLMTGSGPTRLALPATRYYLGTVLGDVKPKAILEISGGTAKGIINYNGTFYSHGPDRDGITKAVALTPSEMFPLNSERLCAMQSRPAALTGPSPQPRAATIDISHSTLQLDLAIDTDTAFLQLFRSTDDALNYIGRLVAAANLLYGADTNLRLRIAYVRLWSTPDPWPHSSDSYAEFSTFAYWWSDPSHNMDAIAGPRGVAVLIEGRPQDPIRGLATLEGACGSSGYALIPVTGAFATEFELRNYFWDFLVLAHELGHSLGSPHTHCYDPPLDHCYNQEAGCYSGPVEVDHNGTIMSYCHLVEGSYFDIQDTFGPVVSQTIRQFAESAPCLTVVRPQCGDGVVDPGEDCDDGPLNGKGSCSAACKLPIRCGDGIVQPGEECDEGTFNGNSQSSCLPTCQLVSRCGDGIVESGEECDDGNQVNGDGCDTNCKAVPPVCGDGIVHAPELCDDGNLLSGDGCDSNCTPTSCGNEVITNDEECDDGPAGSQTCSPDCKVTFCQNDPPSRGSLAIRRFVVAGRRHERFKILIAFSLRAAEQTLHLNQSGLTLFIKPNSSPQSFVTISLPPGVLWHSHHAGHLWTFRNPRLGIKSAAIRDSQETDGSRTINLIADVIGKPLLGIGSTEVAVDVTSHCASGSTTCASTSKRIVCK